MEFMDNEPGIPDYRKKVIFDKQDLQRTHEGMGIGLQNVAKLIDLFEGKIWVEDKVEGGHSQGSNFVVLIPRAI